MKENEKIATIKKNAIEIHVLKNFPDLANQLFKRGFFDVEALENSGQLSLCEQLLLQVAHSIMICDNKIRLWEIFECLDKDNLTNVRDAHIFLRDNLSPLTKYAIS